MNSKEKEEALIQLNDLKRRGLISTPTKQMQEAVILGGKAPTIGNPVFDGVRNYRDMAAGTRADQISIMWKASEGLARGVGAASGSNYMIHFTCFQFKDGKYKPVLEFQ